MTNQEAFDKMMKHLRSLGELNRDAQGICAYDGNMCAIGALLTEEEQEKFGYYKGDVFDLMEYMSHKDHTSALHSLDKTFLYDMQCLHDDYKNWGKEGFIAEEHAKYTADRYGFNYS